jgi:squalene-hopene cyclase-like protein/prenyltransferase/squalene oxidase-like repeat protein
VLDASQLLAGQQRDGGWGYRSTAVSVTEATSFALLALCASGGSSGDAVRRGVEWLRVRQRSDGGWAPRQEVDQSTWVTAVPLLLPSAIRAGLDASRAAAWTVAQSGRESGWVFRLRRLLLGLKNEADAGHPGWPWYPETAAWVTPTALTLLALEKIQREHPSKTLEDRCQSGRGYLLARRCADGGWNHGSTHALGYDGPSYPETTGLALLALRGTPGLERGLEIARRHYAVAKSLEAVSWLRLGFGAHGLPVSPPAISVPEPRTTLDLALGIIADAAATRGNIFLE